MESACVERKEKREEESACAARRGYRTEEDRAAQGTRRERTVCNMIYRVSSDSQIKIDKESNDLQIIMIYRESNRSIPHVMCKARARRRPWGAVE